MKRWNVTCPVCGALNCGLYLEETGGSMECAVCGCVSGAAERLERKTLSKGNMERLAELQNRMYLRVS